MIAQKFRRIGSKESGRPAGCPEPNLHCESRTPYGEVEEAVGYRGKAKRSASAETDRPEQCSHSQLMTS